MNLEVLNETENLFDEVSLLYTAFNYDPSDGLGILRGDEQAIEYLRAKYTLPEMPSIPKIPCNIVFIGIRKVGSKTPDVWQWLYQDRVKVLEQQSNYFQREWSVKTDNSPTIRLAGYKSLLERLLQTLNDFAGKGENDFQDLVQNTSANWSDLFSSLNGYLPHVMRITQFYLDVLTSQPLNTPAKKSHSNGNELGKPRSEEIQRIARRAITLFEDQVKNIIQRENGKQKPLSKKEIVAEAIQKYCDLAKSQRYAATETGIKRYLSYIGKPETARRYAGQLVRQLKGYK